MPSLGSPGCTKASYELVKSTGAGYWLGLRLVERKYATKLDSCVCACVRACTCACVHYCRNKINLICINNWRHFINLHTQYQLQTSSFRQSPSQALHRDEGIGPAKILEIFFLLFILLVYLVECAHWINKKRKRNTVNKPWINQTSQQFWTAAHL